MSQLTTSEIKAKKDALFAPNKYGQLDDATFREIFEDFADSFVSKGAANVPDYAAGTNYPAGYLVQYRLPPGAARDFFRALKSGTLPAPTDPVADANWQASLGPVADNALAQLATVAGLRGAVGKWVRGRLYVLTNRLDAQGAPLPDVCVRALSDSALEPEGYALAAGAPPEHVNYELATDRTAPVVSASSFADLLGVPADNAALAAVLAGKASKQDLLDLIGAAPAALDTLAELAAQLLSDEQGAAAMLATIQQHTQQIGPLGTLNTVAKGSLVAAINEVLVRPPISILNDNKLYTYDTLAAAAASGKANYSKLTISAPVAAAQVSFSSVASINGNGNTLAGLSPAAPLRVSGSSASNTAFVLAELSFDSLFNCQFSSCTLNGRLINCLVQPGNKFNGQVSLEGSTAVPADFFTAFTKNADGTYSTPDGGTITDLRPGAAYTAVLAQLAAVATTLPLTAVRSADYTLSLADAGCLVPVSAAGAVALTLPGQADVALPLSATGYVRRMGAGAVTLVPGANVQFLPAGVGTTLTAYGECSFHKIDLNTYWLKGDLL